MNQNYLWDRSGEPDPEIAHLEKVLGALKYQPRPLEIPADIDAGSRRRFFTLFALAAGVAMLILAGSLWLSLRQQVPANHEQANSRSDQNNRESRHNAFSNKDSSAAPKVQDPLPLPKPVVGRNLRANRKLRVRKPGLDAAEIAQAVAAKEQIMLALRVASSKLNLAHKRSQGVLPTNVIHNQHKVG